MKRLRLPALLALALALAASPAAADQTYHTERLALQPIGGAAGSGMVVNIHPNGPERYAIERYQLRHAEPAASYQIELHLYLAASDCSGAPALSIPTAVILTNAAGNGTARFGLAPDDVAALRGMSFPINWTASQGLTTTHATACTIVGLD